MKKKNILIVAFLFNLILVNGQYESYWHNKVRSLRYHPENDDIVIVNGDKRFNRALYGSNTAFRVETGDVPEFGFYMPNMGGNLQFGLVKNDKSLWLNNAQYIESRYRAGSRIYKIRDPFFGDGEINLSVMVLDNAEGVVIKIESKSVPDQLQLVAIYGGASNKRFWRNGDLGVDDPEEFSLKEANCKGNVYDISHNIFKLTYGQNTRGESQTIDGIFPEDTELKIGSPGRITTLIALWNSSPNHDNPVLLSKFPLKSIGTAFILLKKQDKNRLDYNKLELEFEKAEKRRLTISNSVRINTPDPYLNPLGGIISVAADGIWQNSCWQHGAIGWRMPLNGWRAAYVGDAIGWHDRAREHFNGYAASQITQVEPVIPHPSQDMTLNMTRAEKKWGTQMYSNGYITRNQNETSKMHHYDMNMVYMDELLWHLNWTGDLDYVKQIWPTIKRHLEWEKRNFDPDDDGLYDAYACIWASDALMYNSGGVTYSSAYNYRSNLMASKIAKLIGEDYKHYVKEADKILKAINSQLWLSDKGWWAEYKDFMGHRMLHPNAGVWSVYHAIDSDVHTPFQAYQATRYIDHEIPHIPVLARGLEDEGYAVVSTTNWLPYSWSVNNVAFAEIAHTSLAYWQSGRFDEAYKLFKSAVLDGMYLGSSPGNIGQISFYDAARGESYRDFGDPIGVYSRTVVQGLFGILPDAMHNKLVVRPGIPSDWEYASISTSDIGFNFKRKGDTDIYEIDNNFQKHLSLELQVNAVKDRIKSVTVNGKPARWKIEELVAAPKLIVQVGYHPRSVIEIEWQGDRLSNVSADRVTIEGQQLEIFSDARIVKVYDPQNVLKITKHNKNHIVGVTSGIQGHRTLFVLLSQGQVRWWHPVEVEVRPSFEVLYDYEASDLKLRIKNNSRNNVFRRVVVNPGVHQMDYNVELDGGGISELKMIPKEKVKLGTNNVQLFDGDASVFETSIYCWNIKDEGAQYEMINIDKQLNASVSQIFKNRYESPRSPYTTMQTPVQGIGEWCHPNLTAIIDDRGIRAKSSDDVFTTPFGVPFRTTSGNGNNIVFTTLWDNYPTQISIPISGSASHAYLLMAGTTNHMQSHIVNGMVTVTYKDGTKDVLELINPETWFPIEQDYYLDNSAFASKSSSPYRVSFKTGTVSRNLGVDFKINPNEVYGRNIDGGAGVILDLPLDTDRELEKINIEAVANEVIIGLMSVTLVR